MGTSSGAIKGWKTRKRGGKKDDDKKKTKKKTTKKTTKGTRKNARPKGWKKLTKKDLKKRFVSTPKTTSKKPTKFGKITPEELKKFQQMAKKSQQDVRRKQAKKLKKDPTKADTYKQFRTIKRQSKKGKRGGRRRQMIPQKKASNPLKGMKGLQKKMLAKWNGQATSRGAFKLPVGSANRTDHSSRLAKQWYKTAIVLPLKRDSNGKILTSLSGKDIVDKNGNPKKSGLKSEWWKPKESTLYSYLMKYDDFGQVPEIIRNYFTLSFAKRGKYGVKKKGELLEELLFELDSMATKSDKVLVLPQGKVVGNTEVCDGYRCKTMPIQHKDPEDQLGKAVGIRELEAGTTQGAIKAWITRRGGRKPTERQVSRKTNETINDAKAWARNVVDILGKELKSTDIDDPKKFFKTTMRDLKLRKGFTTSLLSAKRKWITKEGDYTKKTVDLADSLQSLERQVSKLDAIENGNVFIHNGTWVFADSSSDLTRQAISSLEKLKKPIKNICLFKKNVVADNAGWQGEYDQDDDELTVYGSGRNTSRVLAHEIGHHIYAHMTPQDKTRWQKEIAKHRKTKTARLISDYIHVMVKKRDWKVAENVLREEVFCELRQIQKTEPKKFNRFSKDGRLSELVNTFLQFQKKGYESMQSMHVSFLYDKDGSPTQNPDEAVRASVYSENKHETVDMTQFKLGNISEFLQKATESYKPSWHLKQATTDELERLVKKLEAKLWHFHQKQRKPKFRFPKDITSDSKTIPRSYSFGVVKGGVKLTREEYEKRLKEQIRKLKQEIQSMKSGFPYGRKIDDTFVANVKKGLGEAKPSFYKRQADKKTQKDAKRDKRRRNDSAIVKKAWKKRKQNKSYRPVGDPSKKTSMQKDKERKDRIISALQKNLPIPKKHAKFFAKHGLDKHSYSRFSTNVVLNDWKKHSNLESWYNSLPYDHKIILDRLSGTKEQIKALPKGATKILKSYGDGLKWNDVDQKSRDQIISNLPSILRGVKDDTKSLIVGIEITLPRIDKGKLKKVAAKLGVTAGALLSNHKLLDLYPEIIASKTSTYLPHAIGQIPAMASKETITDDQANFTWDYLAKPSEKLSTLKDVGISDSALIDLAWKKIPKGMRGKIMSIESFEQLVMKHKKLPSYSKRYQALASLKKNFAKASGTSDGAIKAWKTRRGANPVLDEAEDLYDKMLNTDSVRETRQNIIELVRGSSIKVENQMAINRIVQNWDLIQEKIAKDKGCTLDADGNYKTYVPHSVGQNKMAGKDPNQMENVCSSSARTLKKYVEQTPALKQFKIKSEVVSGSYMGKGKSHNVANSMFGDTDINDKNKDDSKIHKFLFDNGYKKLHNGIQHEWLKLDDGTIIDGAYGQMLPRKVKNIFERLAIIPPDDPRQKWYMTGYVPDDEDDWHLFGLEAVN